MKCTYRTHTFFPIYADGLVSAGHDISDGGLVTCLLEMAFAGNVGVKVQLAEEREGKCLYSRNQTNFSPGLKLKSSFL